ncbi:hypothetical protein P168DRAFT_241590 [Aspergillus campestris IBT 28561]|uniref:Xylanolytic transcriptional activator regulatory domain-containing protein n=1 Tax=Aspergillus campestris (strain IBT 28561) TaxID=1392248 RepID=A0A2I1CW13_ASPC2|nr:uncharacterized protein P168DRAFT_241590 [Aspergillus campestris IBT 28561]PKY01822.1 hypothetical protein P168DRAFT_241590 [Aspergillus campestris IBT 28561]
MSSLPPDFVKAEIDVYLTYFHDQPYCLFSRDWLVTHGRLLPAEIAYPLVALTSRLSGCSPLPLGTSRAPAEYCTEKAWEILSHHHRSGNVGMSVMQGTFLMAQVDFADGRLHRAYPAVAIAIRTLQSAGLNKDRYAHCLNTPASEERIRLTWAFFMLDRSYNASRNYSLCLSDKHFTLPFPSPDPTAAHRDPHSPIRGRLLDGPSKQGEKVDHGVLACLIRLYSIWGKTTEYVFAPSDKNALPPWQAGSAMARLESDWLQFETHFADAHRYIQVDFQRRAREEPQARGYLATWLYVQFLFHSVQAFLHHPFVIMVKLRQMDGNIPNTFLQKSYESSLLHSRWIARFVREMSEVGFCLYDPFLGYLAAIAATIQLEHTSSRNQQVASLVNKDFRTLVQFINGLSAHYDNMGVLANRVNELATRHKNYGSLYYTQDRYSGALSRMPTPSNIPHMSPDDESLMWDILDLSSCVPPTDTTPLGDLALPPNPPARQLLSEAPVTPTPSDDTVHVRPADHRATLPPLSSQDMPTLYGLDPDGMTVPGWPFAHRNANDGLEAGIPDIPDWLMLGGYEQL